MKHEYEKAALVALVLRLSHHWRESNDLSNARADIDKKLEAVGASISDCEGGLRAFGYNLHDEGVWQSLLEYIQDDLARLGEQNGDDGNASVSAPNSRQNLTLEPAKGHSPRIATLLLARLKEAGAAGLKATPLRQYIKQAHGIDTHPKTIGMTLYRLSQEDPPKVHRSGHVWFFGPPPAAQENPGVGAPGQTSMLISEGGTDGV